MTQAFGTCFGFAVRSAASFRFLREGEGETLEVVEREVEAPDPQTRPLFDWLQEGDRPGMRLYTEENGFRYCVDGGDSFFVEPKVPRVLMSQPTGDAVRREQRLWSLPIVLCFAARGDLALHAAVVEVGDRAVLIAAPRTFGKTTLAAGFLRAGHRMLAEDIACIRLSAEPCVIPGPAMLRLRTDVARKLHLDHAYGVGRTNGRVHLAINEDKRGTCDPVPLRMIIMLREAEGRPRLVRARSAEALRDLWALGFRFPGTEGVAASFSSLGDLAASTPVWDLYRPLRLDSLSDTVEAVVDHV
jgi:hypothetical protein